ncbi:hypothetical protein GW17_00030910 [Ensete ventricosum]|nr:hypothetical protein GW17_00030910 [Ensete ventricosum]RZS07504.1 hypothetical protein BHM03_00038355 [Ensete ventricosum]
MPTAARCQGVTSWSARRVCSTMCCRLVSPSRLLCHVANRPLPAVLQAGRLVASTLPCRQPPAIRDATG